MADRSRLVSQIQIKVDGNRIGKDTLTKLVEVVVDQNTHLPHMFSIRLADPGLSLLDHGPFDLTKEVEILAETADGKQVILIKGETTALEPEFKEGMNAELVLRGYDKTHRLHREVRSRTFLNVKDSDVASQIAQDAGVQEAVDATTTVYDHLYQHNQSDLGFLTQRAWRIGYECFLEDDKLYFRKPLTNGETVTLTWGRDLLSFMPRMSLAEQVDEVIVKGWDVAKKEPITGKSQTSSLYPNIEESKNGADWARQFGSGKLVIVDQPVVSQEEANTLATARFNEVCGAFVEAEGQAFRCPNIRAGRMVTLRGLGERFSGTYLVTGATHVFTSEGLVTRFSVRGARTGLLVEQMLHRRPITRWPGVVPAIVTNTKDPNSWGRVKVKFPWMSEEEESDWARVIGLGAGPNAGLCILPEIDDEVMVSFVHGDFSRPVVLGGVWNGQHHLPDEAEAAGAEETPLVRTWHSRTGHWIAIYDNADNKIEIVTSGGHKIVLDDQGGQVLIESEGDLLIKAKGDLTLESGGDVELKADGQVAITGVKIELN
ncbi:MAG: hypothetical protein D6704_03045 [Nitrospirae bacterium]|nr:MAG: hypothetical protein D6704_03045 [Nitrospirota bacterium]